jgi:hypothetical protein
MTRLFSLKASPDPGRFRGEYRMILIVYPNQFIFAIISSCKN